MGQAKARGTYEERKAQAIARDEAHDAQQAVKQNQPPVRRSLGRSRAATLLSIAALTGGIGLIDSINERH